MTDRCTIKPRRRPAGAATGEVIAEFSNNRRSETHHKGGLVSIRELSDGTVCVEVYRCDPGVVVRINGQDWAGPR